MFVYLSSAAPKLQVLRLSNKQLFLHYLNTTVYSTFFFALLGDFWPFAFSHYCIPNTEWSTPLSSGRPFWGWMDGLGKKRRTLVSTKCVRQWLRCVGQLWEDRRASVSMVKNRKSVLKKAIRWTYKENTTIQSSFSSASFLAGSPRVTAVATSLGRKERGVRASRRATRCYSCRATPGLAAVTATWLRVLCCHLVACWGTAWLARQTDMLTLAERQPLSANENLC